jgi:hypothetical protein
VYWTLRIGTAGVFIGHGAFGIITKAAWLPYFAFAGIGKDLAYRLMPVIGTVDILAGISVLFSPRPVVLLYMAVWTVWTSLLRPFVGESAFEALERAGNYGAPLGLLLLAGVPRSVRDWFKYQSPDSMKGNLTTVMRVLLVMTGLLLFSHGALAAITGKAIFAKHYATLGLPATVVPYIGWAEMLAALLVVARPRIGLLIGIAAWKMATESLYPISGTPIWEFIERFGSYAVPLALAFLLLNASDVSKQPSRSNQ